MRMLRSRQRGNSLVEFAIASAILIPCMSGVFGYGYTFYTYNLLESSVANGARYAAFRTYRCMSSSDIDKGKLAIKNMILYGTPSPDEKAVPVVKNLKTSNIDVTYVLDSNNLPLTVTVSIKDFHVKSVFKDIQLKSKPRVTLPYLGRYAPNESES